MRFRRVFGPGKVVLPVIHVEGLQQALRNVVVAVGAGAPGVFLIAHELDWTQLFAIYRRVRRDFPDLWVGLNLLLKAKVSLRIMNTIQGTGLGQPAGLWVDNARISELDPHRQPAAEGADAERGSWAGLYFGGVAFKYQREVLLLEAAARHAEPYMDVVTTSGPGTGEEATVDKLRRMRSGLTQNGILAVASGVTIDNVEGILPYVDCMLVATGISKTFSDLDPSMTKDLIAKVREF